MSDDWTAWAQYIGAFAFALFWGWEVLIPALFTKDNEHDDDL